MKSKIKIAQVPGGSKGLTSQTTEPSNPHFKSLPVIYTLEYIVGYFGYFIYGVFDV